MFTKKSEESQVTTREASVSEPPRLESPAQAHIGRTLVIEGEIKGEENLLIEGRVNGTINLKQHRVTVGESGIVDGELYADVVEVYGSCKGEINGTAEVTVYASGDVEGNISAPCVALQPGSRFKGAIDMGEAGARKATGTKKRTEDVASAKSAKNGSIVDSESTVSPHVS